MSGGEIKTPPSSCFDHASGPVRTFGTSGLLSTSIESCRPQPPLWVPERFNLRSEFFSRWPRTGQGKFKVSSLAKNATHSAAPSVPVTGIKAKKARTRGAKVLKARKVSPHEALGVVLQDACIAEGGGCSSHEVLAGGVRSSPSSGGRLIGRTARSRFESPSRRRVEIITLTTSQWVRLSQANICAAAANHRGNFGAKKSVATRSQNSISGQVRSLWWGSA